MKPVNDSIPKIIDSGASHVSYDKDSLLKSLIDDNQKPKKFLGKDFLFPYRNLLRFFLLVTTIIVVITLVLTFSFIYFKDILFFKSNLSVNKQGVFMPSKSCGREYCLFLFNTSDLWANTGIYLNEGDKIKMSVSGAFHSSVEDLRRDADLNNPSPNISWIGGTQRKELSLVMDSINRYEQYHHQTWCYRAFHRRPATPKTKLPQYDKRFYCVDTNAYIGAILYRIAPEYQLWDPDDGKDTIKIWSPINGKKYQTVHTSGVLTMAINDIYFKNDSLLRAYTNTFQYRFDTIFCYDMIQKDHKSDDFKTMFYDDNIGQILVCLEIQHPLYWGFFNPLSPFRYLDTSLELKSEKSYGRFQLFYKAMPNFIVFVLYIVALFLIYTISAVLLVYMAFVLGYWLFVLLKTLYRFLQKNLLQIKKPVSKVNNQ